MTDRRDDRPYPWAVEDLLRWYAAMGLCLLGLAVAWWQISGTVRLGRAITWLDVAVLALVLGGLGHTRWLLQGRRAVAIRAAKLIRALPAELPATVVAAPIDEVRVAVPTASRYHRPGCPAVQGKPTVGMTAAEHEQAGRRTCGLCAT